MSESFEHHESTLSRRQFLAASLAAVGTTLVLAACGSEQQRSRVIGDPIDFSHLPDGPLHAKPWQYDVDPLTPTYNKEAQIYTKNQATIIHKHLVIEAIKTATGYESSRINTQGRFNFTHGTITAVAKLPEGVGTWPAIWLLPEEAETPKILKSHGIANHPDSDPAYYAWGGEIDWLETVGAETHPVNNSPAVHTHRSVAAKNEAGISPFVQPVPDGQTKYHEYGLHKESGLLQFTLDGKVVHEVTRKDSDTLRDWPFDDYRYYVIANLAMGGTWGGELRNIYPPNGIDDSKAPWKFQIAEMHYQST